MPLSSKQQFVAHLVSALLGGPWQQEQMQERARHAISSPHSWLDKLIPAVLYAFPSGRPTPWRLREFIFSSAVFSSVWMGKPNRPKISNYLLSPATMESPPVGLADISLPQLATPADLALWLGLSRSQLDWFADPLGLQGNVPEGPLHHYFYRWHDKKEGWPRLIESPKSRLKNIQQQILRTILDQVPVHSAAHGFCKGKSCLSFARPHADQVMVIRMDLKDFFPSIHPSRIHAIFNALGYPWATARLLTGLCTHTTTDLFNTLPVDRRPPWEVRKKFRQPHMPQGAPTSPSLANLCAYRLDCRLSGLANSLDLHYTRYADDLAFSGNQQLAKRANRLQIVVGAIAQEESFTLNMRKTRIMGQGTRQRLTGLVVNHGPNIPRKEYDRLKAILYNCKRYGPETQNRYGHKNFRAYLTGKIAWVYSVNPGRGERLRSLFNDINWSASL